MEYRDFIVALATFPENFVKETMHGPYLCAEQIEFYHFEFWNPKSDLTLLFAAVLLIIIICYYWLQNGVPFLVSLFVTALVNYNRKSFNAINRNR